MLTHVRVPADGWGYVPGDVPDGSMKSKIVFLLYSVRTVIRSLHHHPPTRTQRPPLLTSDSAPQSRCSS